MSVTKIRLCVGTREVFGIMPLSRFFPIRFLPLSCGDAAATPELQYSRAMRLILESLLIAEYSPFLGCIDQANKKVGTSSYKHGCRSTLLNTESLR